MSKKKFIIFIFYSGEGLGKNKSGITECIQIKKRDENLGVK